MGDAFFKILGANYGSAQESLMEAGKSEMSAYLSEELGPLAKEVALFDGSGISHEDTASPEALLSFLSQAKNEKTFPALWQALSIAGVDGTLSDRMRGTIAQGILRGKTGTLSQTSNLSGYVPQYAQEKIVDFAPFVVLSQLNSGDAWNARAAQDRVGVEMVKSLNPQGAGFFLSDFVFPFIPRHSGLDNPFTY